MGTGRPAGAAVAARPRPLARLPALTPPESPAQRIARLRSDAAKVQGTIEQMNNQVEVVVERYNANREALARTQAAQVSTQRRIEMARRELIGAKRQLDDRVWAIYIGGPVSPLAELIGASDLHQALTTARYQQGVVEADNLALARIAQAKRALDTLATQLAAQRRTQEDLRDRLEHDHQQIEQGLAAQRAYLARLTAAVRKALEEEARRQEELRRQALARRLAALRAAKLRAQRSRAAAAGATAAARAVAYAMHEIGKPYQWGATGPSAYDCSGLTQTSYRYAGVAIPRVAADQWNAGPHVSMGELRAGDLVFFATTLSDPRTIHHVGMSIGRGLMVEAPFTGTVVRVSSIGRADYIGATRPTG